MRDDCRGRRGPDGQRVEFQVLGEEQVVSHVMSRFETPWALNVRRLHVLWWAPALPPCGYAAFDLRIESGPDAAAADAVAYASSYGRRLVTADARSAENEFLRLSVNDDGTFDVMDKATA